MPTFCCRYLVSLIDEWAPHWLPACLWYSFLMQMFCTSNHLHKVRVATLEPIEIERQNATYQTTLVGPLTIRSHSVVAHSAVVSSAFGLFSLGTSPPSSAAGGFSLRGASATRVGTGTLGPTRFSIYLGRRRSVLLVCSVLGRSLESYMGPDDR